MYGFIEWVMVGPLDVLVLFVSKSTAVGTHDGLDRLGNAFT